MTKYRCKLSLKDFVFSGNKPQKFAVKQLVARSSVIKVYKFELFKWFYWRSGNCKALCCVYSL